MSEKPKPTRALNHLRATSDPYESFDSEWRKIGLAGPARRALVDAKLLKISDLRRISLQELQELHGMGKSGVARIRLMMEAKKIRFR